MPISMTQNNQTHYLHYDQVGTLRAVSDTNHNIIKEITYDTFGTILSDTNTSLNIPFGFAGGLHDRDTNLVHFGYREYDPQTAKWTAKDPIDFSGGDSNLYGYVLGDPVGFIDPSGLVLWTLFTPTNTGSMSTPKGNGDPSTWKTGKLQPEPIMKPPAKPNCQLIYKSCMELCSKSKKFCTPKNKKDLGKNVGAVGCRTKCVLELTLCSIKKGEDNGGDGSGTGISSGF